MDLSFKEQLIIILDRKKISKKKLAELLNTTRQNLYQKFDRGNFSEDDIKKICDVLNLKYKIIIEDKEG